MADPKDRLECKQCEKTFKSKVTQRQHIKFSHSNQQIECDEDECNVTLKNERMLRAHIRGVHMQIRRHQCEICEKRFHKRTDLKIHLESIHVKQIVTCEICDKIFTHSTLKDYHLNRIHKELVEIHTCDNCNKTFKFKDNLNKHQKARHCLKNNLKPVPKCNFCEINFETNQKCMDHMKAVHGEGIIESFECNICQQNLKEKRSLDHHIKRVHGEDFEPFTCNLCEKEFKSVQGLSFHLKNAHDRISRIDCEICHKSFIDKNSLKSHLENNHNQFRIICSECGHASKNKKSLQYHIQTVHRGIKKYNCNQCQKSFSQKHSLSTHLLSFHQNIKPFECDTCQMMFSEKGKLKKHVFNIHTEKDKSSKNFECDICNARFFTDTDLRRHSKIHDVKVPCEECEKKFTPTNLKVHVKVAHQGRSKKACHICGKLIIDRSQNFNQHLAAVHGLNTAKINHKCELCSKTFTQASHLKTHLKGVHENLKINHKCKRCEKSFESYKSLTIHELQDHGQVCEFCPRRFYEIGKSHNHTREFHTMYKCNQCQREFDTKNNFKEHNKLHLRPGYQCTICDIKLKSKQSATHHFSNVHNNI